MSTQCRPAPGALQDDSLLWAALWLRAARRPELRETSARLYGRMHEWFREVLEETGVVRRVVEGPTHRLSLEPEVLTEAADWMDRQRALWGRMFDVVDEYLKEEVSR